MNEMIKEKLVLVAEDDPDDRLLIKEAFEETGSNAMLVFFENGEELLNYLKDFKREEAVVVPDLFILDLNMPKIDGKEVLIRIKSDSEFRDIPVLVLTTSKSKQEEEVVTLLGAEQFISKPSSFTQLVNICNEIQQKWLS